MAFGTVAMAAGNAIAKSPYRNDGGGFVELIPYSRYPKREPEYIRAIR